jgi:hypothetical protein
VGNSGTDPLMNFLGTTDFQPLELWVNNARALRVQPVVNSGPNLTGGYSGSAVAPGRGGATIAGGYGNSIGNHVAFSFAAGRRAKVTHQGSFVWADSLDNDFYSGGEDEFRVRARGGLRFYVEESGVRFDIGGGEWVAMGHSLGPVDIGRMAQDFQAAFGVGADDKHIAALDANGVTLAAIQGLNQKLTEELKQKAWEIQELKERLQRLEQFIHTTNGELK